MVIPYLDFHCPILNRLAEYHAHLRKNWLFFSSTDIHFLKGFLLAACRHLSMVYPDGDYAQLAIQYKLSYVKSLRQGISAEAEPPSGTSVTRALVLAFDEVSSKNRRPGVLTPTHTVLASSEHSKGRPLANR